MTYAYLEFSKTYEEFKEKFPNHPLTDELRNQVLRGRLPGDEWLKARTKKMKNLMAPIWAR
ncbi:MAG TPA: hypothetical protein VMC85_02040 [Desulfomonilaceae bacterium]|nr:hypothetical protein [Desulfomonilaceae bacterium]